MPLCLAAGALTAVLAAESFTLAWTHSVEKVRWEEDWRIEGNALVLIEARIRGAGAGMEPPPEARLRNGVWHYQPKGSPEPRLRLAHSAFAAPYQLCRQDHCQSMTELLPGLAAPAEIRLSPCPAEAGVP